MCFVFSVPQIFLPVIWRKELPGLFLAEGYNESWNDFMCPPPPDTLRTLSMTRDACKAQVPTPPAPGKPPVALYHLLPRANESPINKVFFLLGTDLTELWLE